METMNNEWKSYVHKTKYGENEPGSACPYVSVDHATPCPQENVNIVTWQSKKKQ